MINHLKELEKLYTSPNSVGTMIRDYQEICNVIANIFTMLFMLDNFTDLKVNIHLFGKFSKLDIDILEMVQKEEKKLASFSVYLREEDTLMDLQEVETITQKIWKSYIHKFRDSFHILSAIKTDSTSSDKVTKKAA